MNCDEFVNLETKKIIYMDKNHELINHSLMKDHLVILSKEDKYRVYDSCGKLMAEFNNTDKLKSAEIEYLNDKVLCYRLENISNYKIRYYLVNYFGEILTDSIYSHFISFMDIDLIAGDSIFGNKSAILIRSKTFI